MSNRIKLKLFRSNYHRR